MSRGIDVSSYQGSIDWEKAKAAGVDFAILKVIRRDLNPDTKFETNYSGCENAGVPIQGVYNYSYATTVAKAKTDAQKVVQVLNGRKIMVWLDAEDNCQKKLGQTLIDIINAYKSVTESAGLAFGVYTGLSFYNSYIKPYAAQVSCPFWIARYGKNDGILYNANKPSIAHSLYGWQYTSSGKVSGISGRVDMNEWYVDIEANEVAKEVPEYNQTQFIKEMAIALGMPATSKGVDVLKKTVTISSKTNRTHDCVTPLERFMQLGNFYTGAIEADKGGTPIFGAGMTRATMLFQAYKVHLSKWDGEWTKGANSYRIALNVLN